MAIVWGVPNFRIFTVVLESKKGVTEIPISPTQNGGKP